jgi:hypothetical protein
MNELLRKRIDRHLENLPDAQGYQLLDFIEFLETKYGGDARPPTTFERISEGVEDTMRAGRLPVAAIRETMSAMDSASRLMQRLADAARSAVDEMSRPGQAPAGGAPGGVAAPEADANATPPPPSGADEGVGEEPPPPA